MAFDNLTGVRAGADKANRKQLAKEQTSVAKHMSTSIAVSGIFRRDQLASGVYSFFENLMRGLAALAVDRSATNGFDLTIFHGCTELPWRCDHVRFRQIPDRFGRFISETRIGAMESVGIDAVLFPDYFTPPLVRARRTVTVIHDLQYLHFPEFSSPVKRAWLKQCHRWTLRACDAVVTISETVRQDLIARYGSRCADRIHAIWNPISIDRLDAGECRDFTGGRPYIMCVAVDRPQKNLHTLIEAFHLLKERFTDHCLVIAGQLRSQNRAPSHWSRQFADNMPSTVDAVSRLGLQDRVFVTGFISDAELGSLYRGASVFVLPSLFEGFGMPAVESMALRVPTLVSDLPVLREVTLNQAHYLHDPKCAGELAARLTDILENVDSAKPSPELSNEIRRRYAPETIARQYFDLLKG